MEKKIGFARMRTRQLYILENECSQWFLSNIKFTLWFNILIYNMSYMIYFFEKYSLIFWFNWCFEQNCFFGMRCLSNYTKYHCAFICIVYLCIFILFTYVYLKTRCCSHQFSNEMSKKAKKDTTRIYVLPYIAAL